MRRKNPEGIIQVNLLIPEGLYIGRRWDKQANDHGFYGKPAVVFVLIFKSTH